MTNNKLYCIKETTYKLTGEQTICLICEFGKLIADSETIITAAAIKLNLACTNKVSKMYLGKTFDVIPVPQNMPFETITFNTEYIEHLF